MLAEGGYAVHLNREFYRLHIPILDSCAYANNLAEVFTYAHTHGLAASLRAGAIGGTVALPWVEALVLAPVLEPSRELCVWLQWIWLLALALSLYWYFTRYRNVPPWRAVCLTLPFAWFESALHWAGGLPDFRMDLSLYIFLALASVWFLMARESGSRGAWLLTGVAGSMACLARATAPVYLAVMLGPLLTAEFVRAPKSMAKRLPWRLAWLAASPALFLILRGAGLNPYVSMPCVFGVLMFAFFPWRDARGEEAVSRPVCALAVAACLLTAATAELPHPLRGVSSTHAAAMHSLIDRIVDDARARGLRDVYYGIPEIGDFHSCAFINTLIYDYRGRVESGGVLLPSGASLVFPDEAVFGASDVFLWNRVVPGKTDALKMDYLVGAALARQRYLLLPDERGLEFLERKRSYDFCNLKVRELKRRLLATGRYALLGEPAEISAQEWIQVYVRHD
jgi:hypothetical protein